MQGVQEMDVSDDQHANEGKGEDDENTVVAGNSGTSGTLEALCSRCTVKFSFIAQENACEECVIKLKAIFNTIQRAGDRKSFLAPWVDEDNEIYDNIGHLTQLPLEHSVLNVYVPKLFVRKGRGERFEHLQTKLGHHEPFHSIKKDARGWMQMEGCDLFCNMLQK